MAIAFMLFLGAILALQMWTPVRSFSESENRVLEQRPTLTFQHMMTGHFTSQYERYVSDQFVLRDTWIEWKSGIERGIGKKESNGIYLGKQGYLIQKFNPPTNEELEEKAAALLAFAEDTPQLRKYAMLIPTAVSVFSNQLPDFVDNDDELAHIDQLSTRISPAITMIDVYPALFAKQEEYIYYRTDHHWTTKGAFYAYQELSQAMGWTPKQKADFNVRTVTEDFYGSLYSKSGYRHSSPDSIEIYELKEEEKYRIEYVDEHTTAESFYELSHLNKKDKYALFLGGNHSLIKITTGHQVNKKLLVVKDSYANSMIPFLTPHYGEIYVVDLRYYDEELTSLVKRHRIQDMLLLYNAVTFFEDPFVKKLAE
ncbi:DHHW family protein [Paenibacillus sp. GM2FR]|uniref:DHHW family protein n=1 Tax=Paenibacillus sp. GM2FR TaxID=2059268 RepID=UPI000C27C3D3|nr:DHHW family protein [Paenibacillus sp. GM2FR]